MQISSLSLALRVCVFVSHILFLSLFRSGSASLSLSLCLSHRTAQSRSTVSRQPPRRFVFGL